MTRTPWQARGGFLAFTIVFFISTGAAAQFATKAGDAVGTAGGTCSSSTQGFAWPDSSGNVLQCVSNLWVVVGQPVTAAGSTGYVQYNNSGALAGSANLFWNNSSGFLGIGTATPANALDVNGAMAVGSYIGTAAPSNDLLVSGNVGIGSAAPNANLDLGSGSLSVGEGLGTTWTTTSGAITIGTTTIPVVSTANYPSAGTIGIGFNGGGTEYVTYTGKTSTSFTGCTRGVDGTTAVARGSNQVIVGMVLRIAPSTSSYGSALTVYSNRDVGLHGPQYPYPQGVGNAVANILNMGTNTNSGSNSFTIGNAAGAGLSAGEEIDAIGVGGNAQPYGVNSQAFGGNINPVAFAEYAIGQFSKNTGSETFGSWKGTDPVMMVGIGTSSSAKSDALMIFQNGQMLVDGATTVAVPAGTASLNAMGTTTDSTAASLNATNSSKTSLLYVRNDGNVGIGTTSPAYLLHVGSASASGYVADFQNSSGYCTLSPGASAVTTLCSSDIRLKANVRDTGDALAWLDDMGVREFTVKATGERRTGVIAQDMLRTHPNMVHWARDGFYAVEEPNRWRLVKALQQLKAAHDHLKAEDANETRTLQVIRARIETLEAARPPS